MEKYEMFQLVEKDGHKGIYIGELDNKPVVVSFKQPVGEMTWHDAMEYAKNIGERLPTQRECMLMFAFKDKLNKVLKVNSGHLLDDNWGWYWSSTKCGHHVWTINSSSGCVLDSIRRRCLLTRCFLNF